jgi:hypothetical protein
VLYTDGVVEARSLDGAFFGEERLNSLLRSCASLDAQAIADRVESAVSEFQEKGPGTTWWYSCCASPNKASCPGFPLTTERDKARKRRGMCRRAEPTKPGRRALKINPDPVVSLSRLSLAGGELLELAL